MMKLCKYFGLFVLSLGMLLSACRSGHDGVTGASAKAKDLPKIIAKGTSEDGLSVSLQNKRIGLKGIRLLAETEQVKNVQSLALKTNKLEDEGVAILASSPTFQHVEKLFLWDNKVTADGIKSLVGSAHFNHLKELNLMKNQLRDEGVILLVQSEKMAQVTLLDLGGK